MNQNTLHKLLLARRLYELSRENTRETNDISVSIGVNLLQDSVELFLLAASEHLNAGVQTNTSFDKYFELINEKIKPRELPFRPRLVTLNKLRVNSKHFGAVPSRSEVEKLQLTVREFFEEVASNELGLAFAEISLIDLIRDGEEKRFLHEAQSAFSSGDFQGCLINCRKAIFVRFESSFDVALFQTDEEPNGFGIVGLFCRAPYYARNQQYIEQHVNQPTDFIVLDHNAIEIELMKSGLDSVSFWNVRRLTPEVYRKALNVEWVVKRELNTLDEDGIRERAEYVLDTTINLFVTADQKIASTRSPEHRQYYVTLLHEQVPVYNKADTGSELVATTPVGLSEIFVDYSVPALNGSGHFWHVSHYNEGVFLSGYISEDVVED